MERWWWLISKKIAFSSSGHSSLDRTSSSISLSKRHTICICTHTLLPLFTVAQLLSVLVDVSRCTHSLIRRYRGLFCLRQQRPTMGSSRLVTVSVGLDEWMACDRARWESYGNFTLYIKLYINFFYFLWLFSSQEASSYCIILMLY